MGGGVIINKTFFLSHGPTLPPIVGGAGMTTGAQCRARVGRLRAVGAASTRRDISMGKQRVPIARGAHSPYIKPTGSRVCICLPLLRCWADSGEKTGKWGLLWGSVCRDWHLGACFAHLVGWCDGSCASVVGVAWRGLYGRRFGVVVNSKRVIEAIRADSFESDMPLEDWQASAVRMLTAPKTRLAGLALPRGGSKTNLMGRALAAVVFGPGSPERSHSFIVAPGRPQALELLDDVRRAVGADADPDGWRVVRSTAMALVQKGDRIVEVRPPFPVACMVCGLM